MRRKGPLAAAIADVVEGVRLTPLWWRLALEGTFNRYRRTLLGPFWIASATVMTGLSIAFVFGSLLGGTWREFLPRVMGGILAWSLVAGTVTDGSNAFLGAGGMMQTQRLPLSFHAFHTVARTVVNFLHQIVAFWIVMACFRLLTIPHWSMVLAIPVIILFGALVTIPVGMLSARYRDIGFMIGSVMGALFLLTPVFWSRAQLSEKNRWIVDYNPFAHLLEIIRQPFLGQMAPLHHWVISLAILAVTAIVALISLALFRKRVVFWL